MPDYLQGDIFEIAVSQRFELAVVFGHIGFNEMSIAWRSFRDRVPQWVHINDPFSQLSGGAHEFSPQQWIWFVPEETNHGMSDTRLGEVFDEIVSWALQRALTRVITNGVADVDHGTVTPQNRASDERRATLITSLAQRYEQHGLRVSLISRNDIFTRTRNP